MDVKKLIKKGKIIPNPTMGQNFVVDRAVINSLISIAEINKNDRVIEVGAGIGILTEKLCQKVGFVYAYEIDEQFKPFLKKQTRKYRNLEICMENIRQARLPKNYSKVIGNIPYHIAEPLVWKFRLEPVQLMAFVMGVQFAKKLVAKIDDKEFCDVSVIFQARFDISIEQEIGKESFYPPAPVKSALVKMVPVSFTSLISDPPRFILRYIWDRKEMKLKNALMEAFIEYINQKSKGKSKLTKNQSRAVVASLSLPEKRLEAIVDSGDCVSVARKISSLDFGRL